MGANKSDKAIEKASRASGGQQKITENFDSQVERVKHSSSHSHRSAAADECKVMQDLRAVKPFSTDIFATIANINLTLDVDETSLRICSFIAVVWGAWYWAKSLFSGFASLLEGKYWSFPS